MLSHDFIACVQRYTDITYHTTTLVFNLIQQL